METPLENIFELDKVSSIDDLSARVVFQPSINLGNEANCHARPDSFDSNPLESNAFFKKHTSKLLMITFPYLTLGKSLTRFSVGTILVASDPKPPLI